MRSRPEAATALRWVFGRRLGPEEPAGDPSGSDGWSRYQVRGHHVESLARELAPFGGSVVVDAPAELRARLAELGRELIATYADA